MKRVGIIVVIVIVALLLLFYTKSSPSTSQKSTGETPTLTQQDVQRKTVDIKEAHITLSYPSELSFNKEPQMNLSTNEPYAVSFTVQNYKDSIAEVENPYQLYGIYQWDTGTTTEAAFKAADYNLDPSTKKSFSVDKRPAISGQTQGERARFTTYILTPSGHILTLAASETDDSHRQITEEIITSITFD